MTLDRDEMQEVVGGRAPRALTDTQGGGGFWTSCAGATVLLGIAAGGLVTIEVGSFGATTGFAIAGWL